MKKLLLGCGGLLLLAAGCNVNANTSAQLQQMQLQQACASQAETAAHNFMGNGFPGYTQTGVTYHYSTKLSKCLIEVKGEHYDVPAGHALLDALLDSNQSTVALIFCVSRYPDTGQRADTNCSSSGTDFKTDSQGQINGQPGIIAILKAMTDN